MIEKPIFIVGHPRSGTTLLATIFGRHSLLSVTPETQFLIGKNDLEALISNDDFEEILRSPRIADLQLSSEMAVKIFNSLDGSLRSVFYSILECYRLQNNGCRIVEKSPLHLWHVDTLLSWFPEAKILCIERNGYDVVTSLMRMPWSHRNIIQHSFDWRKSVFLARENAREYSGKFKYLSYEALVSDPRKELQSLCEFCKIPWEEGLLAESKSAATIPEWERAWKAKASGKIESLKPKSSTMSKKDGFIFQSICADALKISGYPVSSRLKYLKKLFYIFALPYHPKVKPYFQKMRRKVRIK